MGSLSIQCCVKTPGHYCLLTLASPEIPTIVIELPNLEVPLSEMPVWIPLWGCSFDSFSFCNGSNRVMGRSCKLIIYQLFGMWFSLRMHLFKKFILFLDQLLAPKIPHKIFSDITTSNNYSNIFIH